eukprot:gene12329-23620_t
MQFATSFPGLILLLHNVLPGNLYLPAQNSGYTVTYDEIENLCEVLWTQLFSRLVKRVAAPVGVASLAEILDGIPIALAAAGASDSSKQFGFPLARAGGCGKKMAEDRRILDKTLESLLKGGDKSLPAGFQFQYKVALLLLKDVLAWAHFMHATNGNQARRYDEEPRYIDEKPAHREQPQFVRRRDVQAFGAVEVRREHREQYALSSDPAFGPPPREGGGWKRTDWREEWRADDGAGRRQEHRERDRDWGGPQSHWGRSMEYTGPEYDARHWPEWGSPRGKMLERDEPGGHPSRIRDSGGRDRDWDRGGHRQDPPPPAGGGGGRDRDWDRERREGRRQDPPPPAGGGGAKKQSSEAQLQELKDLEERAKRQLQDTQKQREQLEAEVLQKKRREDERKAREVEERKEREAEEKRRREEDRR